MNLPDIDYTFWHNQWIDTIGIKPVYTNANLKNYVSHPGSTNKCELEIQQIIKKEKQSKKEFLKVVDLIYSWGGPSGRMFYANRKGEKSPRYLLEHESSIMDHYIYGTILAKEGKPESKCVFGEIKGIGSSFATKHAYFWSMNARNPLIVIDAKICGTLGFKSLNQLNAKFSYKFIVEEFKKKALDVFKTSKPCKVERALFAFHDYYFLNNNKSWKNKDESMTDFDQAQKLAAILFESKAS